MQFKNTYLTYGVVAKTLHWLMALLIIAAWGVGMYMTNLPDTDPNRSQIYMLHKSVGVCILMLVIIRLSWRVYDMRPRDPQLPQPLLALAHGVHYSLYMFMFVQPLTGWALSSAAGHPPTFFGLFTMPSLVPANPLTVSSYATAHEISAWILFTLFILHVCGALYHLIIVKDDTVQRMM